MIPLETDTPLIVTVRDGRQFEIPPEHASKFKDDADWFELAVLYGTEITSRDWKVSMRIGKGTENDFLRAVDARFKECRDLLLRKHADYGPKNISRSPGGPLNGILVRDFDKSARIEHLLETGAEPQNESLRDSYRDKANYAIIALLVMDGEWPE